MQLFIPPYQLYFGFCFSFIAASFVEIQMILYSRKCKLSLVTLKHAVKTHPAVVNQLQKLDPLKSSHCTLFHDYMG